MRYDIDHILWYCSIAAEFCVLFRLHKSNLIRHYRWFATYLAFSLIRSIALLVVPSPVGFHATNTYWYIWVSTEPVILALIAAFSLEAYGIVHRYYPGLEEGLRRPIIQVFLTCAGVVCIVSLMPDLRSSHWQPTLSLLFVLKRSVTSIAALVLGLVWGAYMFMPVLMPPNIMRHVRLAFFYVSSNAIAYFGLEVWGSTRGTWTHSMMACSVVIFALWTILLSRKGQKQPELDLTGYDPAFEGYWEALVDGRPIPDPPTDLSDADA